MIHLTTIRQLLESKCLLTMSELMPIMTEIREDVKQLSHYIQEQERKKEEKQEKLVEDLNVQVKEGDQRRMRQYQEVVEEDMRRRQEEIREENKLARNLAGWTMEPTEKDDGPVGSFNAIH